MGIPMTRFDGVFFSHDPKTLKITRKNDVKNERLASGKLLSGNILQGPVKITGTGELYGENCARDFTKLMNAYAKRKASVLSVPYVGAVRAVLTELSMLCEPKAGYIGISFAFDSVHGGEKPKVKNAPYRTAEENEDLWDIAYEEGMSINELTALNPHIRFIDSLNEGERVRLY